MRAVFETLGVQDVVAKFGQSFVEFPPMQPAASFNLEGVNEQILKAIQARQANRETCMRAPLSSGRPRRNLAQTDWEISDACSG